MRVDRLVIDAAVRDNFSRTLDRLAEQLREVGVLAEAVDKTLNLDVNVNDRQLDELERSLMTVGSMSALGGISPPDLGGGATAATADGGATPDGGRTSSGRDSDPLENIALSTLRRSVSERGVTRTLTRGLTFDATVLNNLRAALFPLLFTLSATLPAVIAGLTALAGAAIAAAGVLGSIVALGALGIRLNEQLSLSNIATQLRNTFLDAFAPIAESLRPTFSRLVDIAERFITQLGAVSTSLRGLTDELISVANAASQYLIGTIRNIIEFGAVAIDVFKALAARSRGFSITGALAGVLADTLGPLLLLVDGIVRLIPFVVRLSEGFLLVVAVLVNLLGVFGQILNTVPNLTTFIGALAAALAVLGSIIFTVSVLSTIFSGTVLAQFASAVAGAIAGTYQWIVSLTVLQSSLLGTLVGIVAVTAAVITLYSVISLGATAVAGLAAEFNILGGNISAATRKLERFSRLAGTNTAALGGRFTTPRGGRGEYTNYVDNSKTVIRAKDTQTGTTAARKYNYTQRVNRQYTT